MSRATIKKVCTWWSTHRWSNQRSFSLPQYITEHHGLDMSSGMNLSHLNRAIANGSEDNTFQLPKGPSGKVKLMPKTKPAPTNEVCFLPQRRALVAHPSLRTLSLLP